MTKISRSPGISLHSHNRHLRNSRTHSPAGKSPVRFYFGKTRTLSPEGAGPEYVKLSDRDDPPA